MRGVAVTIVELGRFGASRTGAREIATPLEAVELALFMLLFLSTLLELYEALPPAWDCKGSTEDTSRTGGASRTGTREGHGFESTSRGDVALRRGAAGCSLDAVGTGDAEGTGKTVGGDKDDVIEGEAARIDNLRLSATSPDGGAGSIK